MCLKSFLVENGIHHHLICPYTHEQNEFIERKHRHITNVGLNLLAHASLPIKYWGETFTTYVNFINALPLSIINFDTPYRLLFKKQPNYNSIKPLDVPAILSCILFTRIN